MKRTPLKRKTPLRANFFVLVGGTRRKPLRPVSKKRASENVEYEKAKSAWRKSHDGRCEMRFGFHTGVPMPRLEPIERGVIVRCPRRADRNPHHMEGRGPNLARIETFLGVCLHCHNWIHAHAKTARTLGYLNT